MAQRKTLVTGATGLIGHGIVTAAVERGDHVRALVRDPETAGRALPAGVELARGDILEPATLAAALVGRELVFHAAGMPEQYQRDETIFDRVNREGTKNVLEASLAAGVRRVAYTSTMDVFQAPAGGTVVETNPDPGPKPTAYERSKQAAERVADELERRGLDIVHLNPGAVYGPRFGTKALNGFLVRLLRRQVPLIPPGGVPLAFIDGVVQAHLAAADIGRRGERYLLADEHLSMQAIATIALAAAKSQRPLPKTAPAWLLRLVANLSAPLARGFGFEPLIAPSELTLLLWDVRVDSSKAQRELGFRPTPAKLGIQRTVDALLPLL